MIAVGDRVVCVKTGLWRGRKSGRVFNGPIHGVVYTVSWVGLSRGGAPALELVEFETPKNTNGLPIPWQTKRFRKIRPDEHEPCEAEFATLLNLTKIPETLKTEGTPRANRVAEINRQYRGVKS